MVVVVAGMEGAEVASIQVSVFFFFIFVLCFLWKLKKKNVRAERCGGGVLAYIQRLQALESAYPHSSPQSQYVLVCLLLAMRGVFTTSVVFDKLCVWARLWWCEAFFLFLPYVFLFSFFPYLFFGCRWRRRIRRRRSAS
jgi:hypothetical protein